MRSRLFAALADAGAVLSWGAAQPQEIDRLNILRASFLAMRRAVAGLPERPEALLVDGFAIPDLELPQRALIKGDARCLSIAAASIVAKVVRDRMMIDLDRLFPAFGFRKHKGYPTREHVEALRRHGPTPVHRRSFGPVREMLQGIAAG
jgi:ribonuclease HII